VAGERSGYRERNERRRRERRVGKEGGEKEEKGRKRSEEVKERIERREEEEEEGRNVMWKRHRLWAPLFSSLLPQMTPFRFLSSLLLSP
jgi:hypothetical protein